MDTQPAPEREAPPQTAGRPRAQEAVTPGGGRFVAWCGFVFGSLLSIGGNILYTWMPHPPEGAPDTWTPPADWAPSPWSQIGAAAWSVMLLLSVEILSRVRWQNGPLWKVTRYGGASVVALGSAVISYGHLHHVLTEWDYGTLGAAVGPLVIDGLMVVAGFALLSKADPVSIRTSSVLDLGTTEPQPVPDLGTTETRSAGPDVGTTDTVSKPRPTPARRRRTTSTAKAPAIEDVIDDARELVADGAGRPRLVKELGIKDNQARQLLEVLRSETLERPLEHTTNGKAVH